MNQSTFLQLAQKAFAQLKCAETENEHVSPVDLVSEMQAVMVEFVKEVKDEDDLAEMKEDPAFAWLSEEMNL